MNTTRKIATTIKTTTATMAYDHSRNQNEEKTKFFNIIRTYQKADCHGNPRF
jgi:hypothetical protein